MARTEIEGDWVMGWPDRKRPTLIAGKDSQGRVINGRAPITELEGLITPTDAYYVVNQLEVPDPVHPDDWVLKSKYEPAAIALRTRLAKAMAPLAASERGLAELPDNYALAVKSKQYAADYDRETNCCVHFGVTLEARRRRY